MTPSGKWEKSGFLRHCCGVGYNNCTILSCKTIEIERSNGEVKKEIKI
jgi:hypothetical protein